MKEEGSTNSELTIENEIHKKISINNNQVETKTLLIDEIINKTDFSCLHWRIYLILVIFLLADGGEMVVLSLLTDILGKEWTLSNFEKGLFGAVVFVGIFIGSIVAGKISDVKGRKPIFVSGCFIVALFGLLSATSVNFYMFITFRTLFGFGIGMSETAINSLTAEISSTKYRGWTLNLIWICFPVGEILAVVGAKYLLTDPVNGWRYLLIAAAIPCLIIFFFTLLVNESPRFNLSIKNYDAAFNCLDTFLKSKGMNVLTDSEKKRLREENEISIEANKYKPNYSELFKSQFLRVTLLTSGIYLNVSFVYFAIIFISPQSLKVSSSEDEMYTSLMIASALEIPASIISSLLANIKWLGRVRSMYIGFFISIAFSFVSYFETQHQSVYFICLKFAISVPFSIIGIYVVEAFPTKFRTIAYGFTSSFVRFGGIFSLIINQISFDSDKRLPFINLIISNLLGFLFTVLLPYETLGKEII